jgi:hypothetical protein
MSIPIAKEVIEDNELSFQGEPMQWTYLSKEPQVIEHNKLSFAGEPFCGLVNPFQKAVTVVIG